MKEKRRAKMLKEETNMSGLACRNRESVLERTHEDEDPRQDRRDDVEDDFLVLLSSEKRLWPRKMREEVHDTDLRETDGNDPTRTLTRTPQIENK